MVSKTQIKKLVTLKDISMLILKYGFSDQLKRDEFRASMAITESVEPSQLAEDFVADLEKLGPTFVKIGQLLSTRPDLLPLSWIEALKKLQDNVEPISFDEVKEIVESEFGAKISQLFDTFNEKPLASASIGQVHVATLRDSGRKVAVKVQRPGIRDQMADELDAIYQGAKLLEKFSAKSRAFEAQRVIRQFKESIIHELHYEEELSNLIELRENLKGRSLIVIPEPIPDYSTDRVLTMEYISGTKAADLSGVVHVDLDGKSLADELFSSYLQQVLVDGFFHADPHPGNILINQDRKLVILDLGLVGVVPSRMKDQLLQLLLAVADKRSSDVADLAFNIGSAKPNYNDVAFRDEIVKIVEDSSKGVIGQLNVGGLIMQIIASCGNHGLRIPNALYMVGKMLINLDGVGQALCKEFDAAESIKKHGAKMVAERMKGQLNLQSLLTDFVEVKDLLKKAPARLNQFMEKASSNQLKMKLDTLDEDKLLNGFQKVANRITVGLLLAAMIVGASLMMRIDSSWNLFGYPVLAIVIFLAAAVGATGLIFVIIKEK